MMPSFEMFYVNARLNLTGIVVPFNVTAKSLRQECPASEVIADFAITKPSSQSSTVPLQNGGMLLVAMFFLALVFHSPKLLLIAIPLFLFHE